MDLKTLWSPHQGGVSLTFDDGTKNQLEKAVPALDEFGVRGTFYIHPVGDDWMARLEPWKMVAAGGHEIGNHTLTHPCPGNILGKPGGLDAMSLSDIEEDILKAQTRLAQLAPQQKEWTFAYPCYCTDVGRGETRQSYIPLIARRFLAGRAAGEYGIGNTPGAVDLACLWGLPVERMSGYEMIGLVEEITAKGNWAVLVFHEIDGSRLTVGAHDFRMLLKHLQNRAGAIWTAPVGEIARRIATFQRKENLQSPASEKD